MQFFPLPKTVIHHIEALCRNFLWSGKEGNNKKALVAWTKVCDQKNVGGLNVIDLNRWNQATLTKLLWNSQAKADKLWVKWNNVYYLKQYDIMSWCEPQQCPWMLKRILKNIKL